MPEKEVVAGKDAELAGANPSAPPSGEKPSTEKAAAQNTPTATQAAKEAEPGDRSAIELLKRDHRAVETLFAEYEKASGRRKSAIIKEVCAALTIHTMLEENVFYPACRQATQDEDLLDEAQVEHDGAKVLISDLLASNSEDAYRDAKVKVLSEYIKHHVGEEEAPGQGIFAKAKTAGLDTPDLAAKLGELKAALEARREELLPSPLVAIKPPGRGRKSQEEQMARQQGPDRDDRGRFVSDDDDRRGRSSRDRDDGRSYRASGRDDEDGRGWHGDPEGHAEASRRGWAERRGESRSFRREDDDDDRRSYRSQDRDRDERGRFTSDDDDDRRGGYRSRSSQDRDRDDRGRFVSDDDDDRRGGYRSRSSQDRDRDDRGRFTSDDDDDRRGGYRSRSSQDRDRDDRGRFTSDDDDGRGRGRGGWFGDSRGHAEAARRGWEDRDEGGRGRSRDDDDDRRSYRSRSRDDDDRGRGQGGWFGDSRGHAEAARRGWESRR